MEPLARFRVLLVVNDADERSALTQFLAPDFELTAVGSAEEARAALSQPFEVVVVEDAEIARDVAKRAPGCSCILLTDPAQQVSPAERASAGLLTVVSKPWHAVRLMRLLEQSARLTLARRAADTLQKSRNS